MRKVVNAFAVLGLLMASLFVALPSASAATDPSTTAYPPVPGNCAQLNVGATSVHPGDSVLISGSNFNAGDHLTVTLQPLNATVGHVTVGGSGTFSTHFTMPLNASGSQLVVLVGSSVVVCPVDPIQVLGAGVGGSSTSSPGGTAFTGTRIALLVAAAAVLLVGGTALAMAGRRRRSASHHAA